jgi:hypothetical protein
VKTLLLATVALTACAMSHAKADSALDRYCQQAGVTKAEPCISVARQCGKPTPYAMVADRTCMAATIVKCWNKGLRGTKLDACVGVPPRAQLPDTILGDWCHDESVKQSDEKTFYTRGACTETDATMTITQDSIGCKITSVEQETAGVYWVHSRCKGNRPVFEELRLVDKKLVITEIITPPFH